MSKSFDELWRFINTRSSVITVQERSELNYVYDLMRGAASYLEVGTAEGNSLYVLSHAIKPGGVISYIDYGEKHTALPRNEIIALLHNEGIEVAGYLGNSHDPKTYSATMPYDVVLIDAGHSYEDVIADAIAYGRFATKYLIFHDICLPEVERAFEWYCKQRSLNKAYKFINSDTFGYGILKL